MKMFQCMESWKQLYSENPCIHHLESTIFALFYIYPIYLKFVLFYSTIQRKFFFLREYVLGGM